MNKKVLIGIIAVLIALATMYFLSTQEELPKPINPANVVKKTVNMSGMTCEACEIAIEKVGTKTGVVKIKASSPEQKVEVEYDKTQTDIHTIMKEIGKKGFTPLSYEDESGLHTLNTPVKDDTQSVMKCGGEGKCGAGKCGAGKCGGK